MKLYPRFGQLILDSLTHIINEALINEVFTKKLKIAVVRPVLKKS